MMSRPVGRIPLLALLCVVVLQGCDTFTYAVIDNQTGAPLELQVASSEPFEWSLCGPGSDSDTRGGPSTDATIAVPKGQCVGVNHSTVDGPDEVARLQRITVRRDGTICFERTGAAVRDAFDDDVRLTITDAECPP